MTGTLKNLLILLALLATIGLGYFVYFGDPQLEEEAYGAEGVSEIDLKAAQFLARINDIKQIELNSDILSDARFGSLTSFTQTTAPDQIGKQNPFEPQ